jgi:hypothetical protein
MQLESRYLIPLDSSAVNEKLSRLLHFCSLRLLYTGMAFPILCGHCQAAACANAGGRMR